MLNRVTLIGNLGQDPEKVELENSALAKFSVATTESWKDKSGVKQDKTEWHNITAFAHQANFACKYLKKGDKVYIEGSLSTSKWEDKEGNKKQRTEIKAHKITGLGSPKSEQPSEQEVYGREAKDSVW